MHFRKILLTLGLAALYSATSACIEASWFNTGRFQLSRIFDAQINNTTSQYIGQHVVKIKIADQNQTEIISWQSNPIQLSSGVLNFSSIGINANNGLFLSGADYYNSNTYLNNGSFSVTYQLHSSGNTGLVEQCEVEKDIQSNNFPAILLIEVEDQDTLTEKYPIFNWSAFVFPEPQADGVNSFDVEYSILIKEVFDVQSNLDAIQYNPTHHEQTGIKSTSYPYPFNGRPFKDSAIYVWKVQGTVKGQVVSNSEVWRFVYHPKPPKITNTPIVILNPERGTSHTSILNNELKVGYHEKMGGSGFTALRAEILNMEGEEIAGSKELNFLSQQGFNVFSVSLCPDGLNLPDGQYTLHVYSINGLRMELTFKYNRTNNCE